MIPVRGAVLREEKIMNDHIYRWVPKGMQVYALGNDAPAGAEVWISEKESGFSAIAYSGRRGRHDWHYSFRSRARMVQEIEQWVGALIRTAAAKAAAKVEKKELASAPHGVEVGDVFRASWGYEQTNIDYYEVVQLHGRTMATVRQIGKQSVGTGWEQGQCVPVPGAYCGEPMRVRFSRAGSSVAFKVSCAHAYKLVPQVVGGVKLYGAEYWSSYA